MVLRADFIHRPCTTKQRRSKQVLSGASRLLYQQFRLVYRVIHRAYYDDYVYI